MADKLAEHQSLMAIAHQLIDQIEKHRELASRQPRLGIDQTGMTAGPAQPRNLCQDVDLALPGGIFGRRSRASSASRRSAS